MNPHPIKLSPSPRRFPFRAAGWAGTLALGLTALVGCTISPTGDLSTAYSAYEAGQYELSLGTAEDLLRDNRPTGDDEAAYVAGLSASKLNQPGKAVKYLTRASQSSNLELAGDAGVSLGTVYTELGRHTQAAQSFEQAAAKLGGEKRARALIAASESLRRLGRLAEARTQLILARAGTQDQAVKQEARDTLAVAGYTIQLGAFKDPDNARARAQELAAQTASLGLAQPRVEIGRDAQGRVWHYVYVGAYSTFRSAQQRRALLQMEAVIVPVQGGL